ncbi:hypothetical protein [Paraburkholderia caledonica]|uniref:hypothetical protein n=1 Tax=Paraburkholderia caledonica TaxID=134536 RepID=UPI000DEEC484|nr:hypothetical protein [Paraburkholderia caledonica]AXF19032.1 hypothetical protein CUJ87_32585 [Paraburkholderia caledonica]
MDKVKLYVGLDVAQGLDCNRIREGAFTGRSSVRRYDPLQGRRLAFIGELPKYLRRPPLIPRLEPTPDASAQDRLEWPRSCVPMQKRGAWSRRWPHVGLSCAALDVVYRNARRNHGRRLARSFRPVQPGTMISLTDHGLLLIDGTAPAMSIALLGWRMSWERRFSAQTLTRCAKIYPPFGLLEWLAFMPAHLPPPSLGVCDDWLLRHFLHALRQTWNTWCAIASEMQENGRYVISPLFLPTRAPWLDAPTHFDSFVVPRLSGKSHMFTSQSISTH